MIDLSHKAFYCKDTSIKALLLWCVISYTNISRLEVRIKVI
jgi:hypothetical protein